MPTSFALDNIPTEMVQQVVNKVPAYQLINLHRANKRLNEICEGRMSWAYRNVPMILVSRNGIEIRVGNQKSIAYEDIKKPIGLPISLRCSLLNIVTTLERSVIESIEELKKTLKCQFDSVSVVVSYLRTSSQIHDLLQIVRPYKVYVKGFLQKSISPSIFNQLAIVHLEGSEYSVSSLCKIKAGFLTIHHSELTSEDCNLIIQNWYERPRKIRLIQTRALNVTIVTAGLPLSLVYNTECHEYSMFSKLNQTKFDDSLKKYSFFMLIKPDALSEKAMLIIGPNSLEIVMPCHQPHNILFPLLKRLSHDDYARFAAEYCTSCRNHTKCHCSCYSRSQ